VVERAGQVDVSFNLVGLGDVQKPLTEISVEEPVTNAIRRIS
jgi:3-oxoacyl-[acyl-carrier protein] reductase